MENIKTLLAKRTHKTQNNSKMIEMAKRSAEGSLTSFSGVFTVQELAPKDKELIKELLEYYATPESCADGDLRSLISLTSEIKAIDNQAILLHGERISKAHKILTTYRDGAFTAWLILAYGNRQTPYNFFHYYRFHTLMPEELKPQLEKMPRQAIYTLASRDGDLIQKKKIVSQYSGETKQELMDAIRVCFPLDAQDKRGTDSADHIVKALQKLIKSLSPPSRLAMTQQQKQSIFSLLETVRHTIEKF